MTKPIASLSLDLDNKWAYMRTHGAAGWEKFPSYFDTVVPRVLRFCIERDLRITCFVVGRDAAQRSNHNALAALAAAGHEIGNHSLNHYPWMHTLPHEQVEAEIEGAESLIEHVTGHQPIGFRGPGYSFSKNTPEVLARRGYLYDGTTLPTYIGPLARWYFRRTASAEAVEQAQKRELFGVFCEGRRSIKPFVWNTSAGPLIEIPVTTFPIVKLPIHMTYLLHLWQYSPRLAKLYLRMALAACRRFGIGPSVLLHPLEFLGCEDDAELRFFPGMNLPRAEKSALLEALFEQLSARFQLVPMCEQAEALRLKFGVARPQRRELQATPSQLIGAGPMFESMPPRILPAAPGLAGVQASQDRTIG
jgi:hypothetical protein